MSEHLVCSGCSIDICSIVICDAIKWFSIEILCFKENFKHVLFKGRFSTSLWFQLLLFILFFLSKVMLDGWFSFLHSLLTSLFISFAEIVKICYDMFTFTKASFCELLCSWWKCWKTSFMFIRIHCVVIFGLDLSYTVLK